MTKHALCGEQITSQVCSDCSQRVVVSSRFMPINPSAENGHRISRVRTQRFICGSCLDRRERSRLLLDRLTPKPARRCPCGRELPVASKSPLCHTCRAVRERGDRRFREA